MLSTPPRTGQAPAPAPHAARAPSGAAGMPLVFDEPSPAAAAAPHAPDTPAPAAPGGAPALGPGQMVAAAGAAGLAAAEGEGAGAAAAATGAPAAGGDEEVLWHGEEHAAPDAAAPMGPLAPVAQAADMAAAGKARDEVDRSAGAGNRWMPKPATPLADLGHAAPRPAPVRTGRPRLCLGATADRASSTRSHHPLTSSSMLHEHFGAPTSRLASALPHEAVSPGPAVRQSQRGSLSARHGPLPAARSTLEVAEVAARRSAPLFDGWPRFGGRRWCRRRSRRGACCPRSRRRRPMTRGARPPWAHTFVHADDHKEWGARHPPPAAACAAHGGPGGTTGLVNAIIGL